MHIGITGATGLIGQATISRLVSLGHTTAAFTRNPEKNVPGAKETRLLSIESAPDVSGLDTILHLAGEPIFGIWTASKKRRLRTSRIDLTRHLVDSIRDSAEKPTALISASGISFYGDGGNALLPESAPKGEGFLSDLAADWEHETTRASDFGIRTATMRFGAVLALDGGMFPLVKRVFRLCLGGRLGSGSQWMSWVHLDDVVSLLCAAVENEQFKGAVNVTAPGSVTNRDFTRTLASALNRPAIFPAPAFALKLILRGLSDVALQSQRCQPKFAQDLGFEFAFRDIRPAIDDLLTKERSR